MNIQPKVKLSINFTETKRKYFPGVKKKKKIQNKKNLQDYVGACHGFGILSPLAKGVDEVRSQEEASLSYLEMHNLCLTLALNICLILKLFSF